MLQDFDVTACAAVRDMTVARRFYEETLGLQPLESDGDRLVVYRSGESKLVVYVSAMAGTNLANAASWSVGDRMEQVVAGLKARGVQFEHYDMPGIHLEGDVHVGQGMKAAWFKDPDGNILNLASG